MTVQPAIVDTSLQGLLAGRPIDLGDLDAIRLVLRGDSVIDWNRLHFRTLDDVDAFLHLHLFDPEDPDDQRRMRFVQREAVNYLEEHLGLHFPDDLKDPDDVRSLFLMASETGGFRRHQIQACVLLKLMHVINHMEAAELRFQTPLSEASVFDLAERRIVAAADRMRSEGFPLVAFYGSRKTRNSVITKLIAKRETVAATIFDKLRFRLVTDDHTYILPALAWLTRNLFPFNYLIPGQSHNNLVRLGEFLQESSLVAVARGMHAWDGSTDDAFNPEPNPFSGSSYRMVNFIVDFPVRVDHLVPVRYGALLGRCVYVLVEFQVLDRETARSNEEGDNAHRLYKQRQREIVAKRLRRGVAARKREERK